MLGKLTIALALFLCVIPVQAEVIDIGNRREVLWDDYLIDSLDGAQFELHTLLPMERVLQNDKPWEGAFNGGISVFAYAGKFHLYYRGLTDNREIPEYTCYATSQDGITWTKPKLGLAEVMGSRDNNIIVREDGSPENFFVFLDTAPGIPEEERIKGIRIAFGDDFVTPWDAGKGHKRVVAYTSADGYRFVKMPEQPQLTSDLPNAFDAQNVIFWSEAENAYICYFRHMVDGVRAIARSTSPDFIHWTEPVRMTYSDTGDIKPSANLYIHCTQPYFRAPHHYLALPARFMPGRRVVTDAQLEQMDMAQYHVPEHKVTHVYYKDCSDALFMSTRAGTSHYDRTCPQAMLRPGPGPENWVSRTNYPFYGVVQTAPGEVSFYVSRHYAQESWHVRRYAVRLDGFISLHSDVGAGEVITKPLRFSGDALELNFSTSAAGSIRVEVQTEAGAPVPGFTLEDCPEIIGDELARTVSWKGGSDLSGLSGQPVRLRFVLQEADLFSLRFVDQP